MSKRLCASSGGATMRSVAVRRAGPPVADTGALASMRSGCAADAATGCSVPLAATRSASSACTRGPSLAAATAPATDSCSDCAAPLPDTVATT